MAIHLFRHLSRKRHLRVSLLDSRPCAICGLAAPIRDLNHVDLGRFCIYYGLRIPTDQANAKDPIENPLRQHCIKDGNLFIWPLKGFTSQQLLEWRKNHTDWYLIRNSIKIGALVSLATVMVALLSLIVSLLK